MARATGMWSSPASSADEAEAPAASGGGVFEFEAGAVGRKRSASGARLSEAAARKSGRRLALGPEGAVKSARELVEGAPAAFAALLAEQLGVRQQARLGGRFGAGQGFLVQAPGGMKRTERARLGEWLAALGFAPGPTLGRGVARISSLKADVIIRELLRRELPGVDK